MLTTKIAKLRGEVLMPLTTKGKKKKLKGMEKKKK